MLAELTLTRLQRLVLILLSFLCLVWGVSSLWLPFGWDHGLMALVGDRVLQGGMPYRDAWDIKGPLAHLWFAAAQWLFGRGQVGIRVLDLIVLVTCAAALVSAAGRLMKPHLAPWMGIALILWWASLTFFFTAQPDGVASLGLTLAFLPLLFGPAGIRHFVVAGFVVGLATITKPIYLAFFVVVIASVLVHRSHRRERAAALLASAAAAAVPVLVIAGWFAARGAVDSLVEVLLRYNAEDYSGVTDLISRERLYGFGLFANYFLTGPLAPGLPLLLLGGYLSWRRRESPSILIMVWLATALGLIVVQGKYFVYHWTIAIPPIILTIGQGLNAALEQPSDGRGRPGFPVLGGLVFAAFLAQIVVAPAAEIVNWGRYVTGIDSRQSFYERFKYDTFVAFDQLSAAEYIQARTSPTDRVALLGYDAPALYLSGRPNATRFTYALPLVSWRTSEATRSRYRREFLDTFADPPTYVMVGLLFAGKGPTLRSFPEFGDVLKTRYVLERSFGDIDLYRRVDK